MKRVFGILFAVALVLGLSLVATAPVAAATLNVPGGYGTIQAAINAAGSGDTINVAAGTYTEDLFIHPSKQNLELAGAGAGTTTIKGTTVGVGGVPNINIHADGVKIHGFTIETADCNGGGGGWVDGLILNGIDIEIYDNVFKVVSSVATDYGAAIQTWASWNVPLQNTQYGLSRVSDISGLNIHDNEFTGVGVEGYYAVYFNPDLGSGLATISGNTMGGPLYLGASTERSNDLIEDNVISSSYAFAASRGIHVYNYNDTAQQDVAIEGNTVSGCDMAIRIGGGSQTLSNISVTGNAIHSNNTGILVRSSAGGVVVNYNDISGNTAGVSNTGGGTLDATYNWWGADDGPGGVGPGTGDTVSANVNYVPWATKTATGAGNAYITPSAGTVVTGLTGVAAPAGAPVSFPYGMFSFVVTGVTGQVTLTIELPGPMPVGSKWYKYNGGAWDPMDIGDDDGDNVITVTLRDDVLPDDEDTTPNQITDQAGPSPGPVGWETYPVSKASVLLPWIVLGLVVVAGGCLLVLRRRRTTT